MSWLVLQPNPAQAGFFSSVTEGRPSVAVTLSSQPPVTPSGSGANYYSNPIGGEEELIRLKSERLAVVRLIVGNRARLHVVAVG